MTDDLSWILADGESLDDALADFTEDVKNPARVHARHEQIRKIYDGGVMPKFHATIVSRDHYSMVVEAKNEQEAEDIVNKAMEDGLDTPPIKYTHSVCDLYLEEE
tara:strand:- start:2131 stop:2445 length:315 start_codon:yes stop_codon:yes gene_type:complete